MAPTNTNKLFNRVQLYRLILIHLLDKPVCGIIKRFNLNRCIQLHIIYY